ncbi:MAG: hypothetical protein SFV15_03920 [Polyangiaceae bacterium]|nr:hypothetical protein [Polyangiaceae bacterium]
MTAVAFLVFVAGVSIGCAHAPPPVPGPLRGPGFQANAGYYGTSEPLKLTFREPASQIQVNVGQSGGAPVIPHRFGGRWSGAEWFDLGADVTLLDAGGDVRFGMSEKLTSVPWSVSLGGRSGGAGPISKDNRSIRELRLRLDAYPRLARKLGLSLSAGISRGRRWAYYEAKTYDNFVSEGVTLLWEDTRLEATLGANWDLSPNRFGARAGVMPYVILGDAQGVKGKSSLPAYAQLTDVSQDFGFVFFLDIWAFIRFGKKPTISQDSTPSTRSEGTKP